MNCVLAGFDLELGLAVVVFVFPSLTLPCAQREDMYVRSLGLLLPRFNRPVKCVFQLDFRMHGYPLTRHVQ